VHAYLMQLFCTRQLLSKLSKQLLNDCPQSTPQWEQQLQAQTGCRHTDPCNSPLLHVHRFGKAAGQSATVMLVRDAGGYVFIAALLTLVPLPPVLHAPQVPQGSGPVCHSAVGA
jgi:hypothetical protein